MSVRPSRANGRTWPVASLLAFLTLPIEHRWTKAAFAASDWRWSSVRGCKVASPFRGKPFEFLRLARIAEASASVRSGETAIRRSASCCQSGCLDVYFKIASIAIFLPHTSPGMLTVGGPALDPQIPLGFPGRWPPRKHKPVIAE